LGFIFPIRRGCAFRLAAVWAGTALLLFSFSFTVIVCLKEKSWCAVCGPGMFCADRLRFVWKNKTKGWQRVGVRRVMGLIG